ncbi:EVI5-like protein [Escovopsis weberi]|uniref:EVI5-like protein n=1 Tax=Escovopsis weberi TaxID=150374 RepID=A0A0M8MWH2_ESCWE|nr:EVI5-like protein [Escovopsis weberi]
MTRDSMVTVRLSEPPALTLDSDVPFDRQQLDSAAPSLADSAADTASNPRNSESSGPAPPAARNRNLQDELGEQGVPDGDSEGSDQEEVNWEELEKTEDEQTRDEETDSLCELQSLSSSRAPGERPQSTALLLARLEQENAKLATNPKSVKVQAVERAPVNRPRPPSMAQLRQMVSGPTAPALRYSMLPPPAMTDLEFWAALVKDYQQTAARLPTLFSNKIRKGIPPPLRGVVWQSMSGARDAGLEGQYDRICGETSPYELLIGKDLGRSFPGVDMFRDPEGDGQRMLGRVLKSFSIHDTRIGYCQGLAFLVGPLLMHMPDKQAFCILVRLMERYDLRSCFLPDLSGLHVRIYQFRELLRLNLPALWSHMEDLQVETAYVSQWFLSFFAVTCPLPMLFRIYDVIFAEGACETLMRVALSLMRKNEARLLSCTEMEDVMQLLLSRGLWDCYHYNADEFVHDFVSLSNVVTREKLSHLEQDYRESLVATTNAVRTSDITTAATRFLGRIWAPSSSSSGSPKTATLTPGRPLSMLRRSASKQSLASTLNSIEASSIEDLLTALSEMQRNHALLTHELQREREEREEDRKAVQALLDGLRKKATHTGSVPDKADGTSASTNEGRPDKSAGRDSQGKDAAPAVATETTVRSARNSSGEATGAPSTEDLSELLNLVERRFAKLEKRRASMSQSKPQLRAELAQAKDQLASAMSQNQGFNRRIHDLDQEMVNLREQLRESHGHVRTLHQDKQRLEKQIYSLKSRPSSTEPLSGRDADADRANRATAGGLREFKLGRAKSASEQGGGNGPSAGGYSFNRRKSSLFPNSEAAHSTSTPTPAEEEAPPISEHDTLLLELVQAKTAEAVAKQDAEESRQKLEALRKACGITAGDSPSTSTSAGSGGGGMGVFGRFTGGGSSNDKSKDSVSTTGSSSPGGSSFWSWRK